MNVFQRKLAPALGAPAARHPRRAVPRLGWLLAALGIIALALMVGFVVALGSAQLTIVVAGLLFLLPVVALVGTKDLLPIMFVYIFLIQGLADSYFHLRLAIWMGSGMAFLFLCRTLMELSNIKALRQEKALPSFGVTAIVCAAGLYLLFFFFMLALGQHTLGQLISSVRFSVPMFGVLLAMYCFKLNERRFQLLWMLIFVVTFVQIPPVLYQHFIQTEWDDVVGTFGFGLSPVLVLFSLVAMVYAMARWSYGLMSAKMLALILVVGLHNILMGEVKAVLFWLPLCFMLIMRKRILKNVFAFVGYILLIGVFMVGTVTAYKAMYWGEKGTSGSTIEEKISRRGGYFFNPYEINHKTGEVSRIASLYLWYVDPIPGVMERLVGYGPGASAASESNGLGVVATRYRPLRINSTAFSSLLWDVGILGTLSYVLILIFGVLTAWRFVRRNRGSPAHMAIVDTSMVTLVLLFTTMIYNRTVVDSIVVQLLLFFCLGSIVQCVRFGKKDAGALGDEASKNTVPLRAL